MKFINEAKFRDWICTELARELPDSWIVMKGKNVADIILSRQVFQLPLLVFLEVKYHREKHDRIPIGGSGGRGYQPEYLLLKIEYLEQYLRWIVADEILESCLFLTNEEVREFACGGGIKEGKHNNLKTNIFETKKCSLVSIHEIPKQIASWVQGIDKKFYK